MLDCGLSICFGAIRLFVARVLLLLPLSLCCVTVAVSMHIDIRSVLCD
jgi:hypothetical protein